MDNNVNANLNLNENETLRYEGDNPNLNEWNEKRTIVRKGASYSMFCSIKRC